MRFVIKGLHCTINYCRCVLITVCAVIIQLMHSLKNATIVLLYDTVSLFLVLFKVIYSSQMFLGSLFQQYTSLISATHMR